MARPKKVEEVVANETVTTNEIKEEVKQDKLVTVTLNSNYSPNHIVYMKEQFIEFKDGNAKVTKTIADKLKEMGLI